MTTRLSSTPGTAGWREQGACKSAVITGAAAAATHTPVLIAPPPPFFFFLLSPLFTYTSPPPSAYSHTSARLLLHPVIPATHVLYPVPHVLSVVPFLVHVSPRGSQWLPFVQLDTVVCVVYDDARGKAFLRIAVFETRFLTF